MEMKIWRRMKIILSFTVFFFLFAGNASAQTFRQYDLVKDFGAVANDKFNNYKAFQKAAAFFSGKKNVVLNIPTGKYYISDYKVSGGIKKNSITDVIFKNISGFTIKGNNSTIRVNGNFKRSADTKIAGLPFDYSYSNTVCPFLFENCSNVLLNNIIVLGGVQQMTRDAGVVEGACYGIMIADNRSMKPSYNIVFENIVVKYFATDGLYINCLGKIVKVNNSKFLNNGRQGISIVGGVDITISNSSMDSTGYTGRYGNHSPSAGIDVENENSFEELDNIKIVKCNLRGNIGFQFVSTANSGKVSLDSCFIVDNGKGYGNGFNGIGLYSKNSSISNCVLFGMMQLETANENYRGDVPLQIKNNIIYSGVCALLSSDYNTPMNITGNILIMLPKPIAGQFFPYIRNGNAVFNKNLIITHLDRLASHKNEYTALMQFVKNAENNFWFTNRSVNANGKTIAANEDFYGVSYDGTKLIGKQFYPDFKSIRSRQIKEDRLLNSTQTDQLFRKKFLTDFKQTSLNLAYLKEATAVRKLMEEYSNIK